MSWQVPAPLPPPGSQRSMTPVPGSVVHVISWPWLPVEDEHPGARTPTGRSVTRVQESMDRSCMAGRIASVVPPRSPARFVRWRTLRAAGAVFVQRCVRRPHGSARVTGDAAGAVLGQVCRRREQVREDQELDVGGAGDLGGLVAGDVMVQAAK